MRVLHTAVAALLASACAIVLLAGPAAAHVTVSSNDAVTDGYSTLTFKVPNEEVKASVVGLTVTLPPDAPIASVSVLAQPGWTFAEKTAKPTTPITTDDGPVDTVVTSITWTATGTGIAPGQFGQFVISAGPLPSRPTVLHFSALQTYSDGSTADWDQIAAPGSTAEPDHPAPALSVSAAMAAASGTAAGEQTVSASSNNTLPVALSVIALVVALGAAGIALSGRRGRRSA